MNIERVVGIDPGSHHLGVGCIERSGNTLSYLFADTLSPPKNKTLYERLEWISKHLSELLEKLRPHTVAIENIFFAKNPKSAFHLGLARGTALSCCFGRSLKIYEYSPNQIKSVVTGYGRADKEQVAKMVRLILTLNMEMRHDSSDALAIAICHANLKKFERRVQC